MVLDTEHLGVIVGPPGVMKSPAVNEGMLFFKEIAEQDRLEFEAGRKQAKLDRIFAEAKQAEILKRVRKAHAGPKEELMREYEAYEVEERKEVRRWTSDVTTEKLGELLNENEDGILIVRDELTGWLRSFERQGHEQDKAFYLEAWDGGGSFAFDRIGRGRIYIKNVTVSVIGTIQPAKFLPLLRGSIEGNSDDGLVQRFQVAVYPEAPKEFRYVDRPRRAAPRHANRSSAFVR